MRRKAYCAGNRWGNDLNNLMALCLSDLHSCVVGWIRGDLRRHSAKRVQKDNGKSTAEAVLLCHHLIR
ncbi:hypothetical protein KCP70_02195 [Salmonella enterica subsp. enterica]|nr:hypothetical protein KCP70_02195 [Salmonella enterica subsp. enterica]